MSQENALSPFQPRKFSEVETWDFEADVVIIGFGGTGACAAIEASDAGADVLLLELASASGGSTALSSAEVYLGGSGGTRVQQACGYHDSTEDMFNYLMLAGGDLADEARIRAYCDGSVDHFEWLVSMGVPYKDSEYKERAIMALTDDCLLFTGNEKCWPFEEVAKPCPRGHNLEIDGDNGGPLLMKILTEQVEKRGIRVEYNARALALISDDENRVGGVVARLDGREMQIRAQRGVILCSGGFVMNREMLSQHCPQLLDDAMPIGNPGDTGSGIRMGQSVGAALIHMDSYFITLPYYPPSSLTHGIFVNQQAQRFINEDCYHARIAYKIFEQLDQKAYLIVSAEDYEHPKFMNAPIVGTGESIDELAEEVGLHPGMLSHTIEFYSEHAARGEDPLFHKSAEWLKPMRAPYAALDCTPGEGAIFACFTLGGLHTRPGGEVLSSNAEVVRGLYAAGRTACGIPRSAAGYASGLSVGDATFFGRMAGLSAAADQS